MDRQNMEKKELDCIELNYPDLHFIVQGRIHFLKYGIFDLGRGAGI
jgi:hypothetical protein